MISCTEFVPSYSELFSFLEEEYGYAEVERYWNDIFDRTGTGSREPEGCPGLTWRAVVNIGPCLNEKRRISRCTSMKRTAGS